MNKLFKFVLLIVIIVFVFLYFSYRNGYYIKRNREDSILTEEKIREYENDLKKGVDVSKKNYIVTKDTYDNNYSRLLLRVSSKIEKGFDKVVKLIFHRLSQTINE